MKDKIKSLLNLAITAPSGDNCQPWRFTVNGLRIDLFNDPAMDTSYYNYLQRASLVSHGAVLENISIAAPPLGFNPIFKLFPSPDDKDHVATILLEEIHPLDNELAPYLQKRVTNRRQYDGTLLDDDRLDSLYVKHEDLDDVSIFLTNSKGDIDKLSSVISLNDRIVFENRQLHEFLFEHIRWSDEEASRCRDGLDIKTLELNAVDTLGFKMLKNWAFTNFATKLGASRIVAGNARKLAESASAIGLILGKRMGTAPLIYLEGGRLMQRIWLHATKMGLSFHVMTGISFLMQRIAEQQDVEMSSKHVSMLRSALKDIELVTDNADHFVIAMFRIGQTDSPTVRSQRKDISKFINGYQ